jgi:hypothetical protein
MLRPGTTSKNSFLSLLFSKGFWLEITPPACFLSKNFQPQNPAYVADGVGLGPWQAAPTHK